MIWLDRGLWLLLGLAPVIICGCVAFMTGPFPVARRAPVEGDE